MPNTANQNTKSAQAPQADWIAGGAKFQITHYTYAREDDPKHAKSPKISAPGLNEKYRASFLGSPYGIKMQGTGLAENGKYIRYAGNGRYSYGVGGAYAKIDKPYQQIAVDPKVITPRRSVLVEPYADKGPMSADDVGGRIKGRHIDVFVGPVNISVAYALGTKSGRVGYTNAAAKQGEQPQNVPIPQPRPADLGGDAAGAGAQAAQEQESSESENSEVTVEAGGASGAGPALDRTGEGGPVPSSDGETVQGGESEGAEQESGEQDDGTHASFEEPHSNEWQKVVAGQLLLKQGMMNNKTVEELQRRLVAAGYETGVDGHFGGGTKRVVQRMQADYGFKADGVVGKDAASALSTATAWQAVVSGKLRLKLGVKGPAVTRLQALLTKAGNGVATTGEFGPTTEEKVKEFQKANEIEVTAEVGPTTAKALQEKATSGSRTDGFIWPVRGGNKFTSPWGPRNVVGGSSFHRGIDIQGNPSAPGTPIIAAAAGKVVSASGGNGGYGNMVDLEHKIGDRKFFTRYAHLSSYNVAAGQEVAQAAVIGAEGGSGSKGPKSYPYHLHFEIHEDSHNNKVDPLKHLAVPGGVTINFENSASRLKAYGNFRRDENVTAWSY